jgi:VCBS repeat-containing protein
MVTFTRSDLEFILQQIQLSEAGQVPVNPHLAFGLRAVDGTDNSLVPGQSTYGSSDQPFPRVTDPLYQNGQYGTSYANSGTVVDSDPRTISNLIADQTAYFKPVLDTYGNPVMDPVTGQPQMAFVGNPAALDAANTALGKLGTGYQVIQNPAWTPDSPAEVPQYIANPNLSTPDATNAFIPNVVPDNGLSAPYNTLFTLFGQFFDHGLDLVGKGGNGYVYIPLQPDDPLYKEGSPTNFMILSRATVDAGKDGILGTADDVNSSGTNSITPFVDQSQTYASDPSHQVFLREYIKTVDPLNADTVMVHTTGKMLGHTDAGKDGIAGNADDGKHMATWGDLKHSALVNLGIELTDADVNGVPLLATDKYGNFYAGAHGFAQVVVKDNATGEYKQIEGFLTTDADGTQHGLKLADLAANGYTVVSTGHAFINDKAAAADPFDPQTGALLKADDDTTTGLTPDANGAAVYDNELLDSHFVAGDGRVNENIGLTAIHEVFHNEHNRLVDQTKALIQAELDKGDQSFAREWVIKGTDLDPTLDANGNAIAHQITDAEWDGERLFQAAKFGTETQYQHLVFEEFARKVSPAIHVAGDTNIHLDPAITAEFADAVYRFGHSMLDETLNRYDAQGNPILDAATGKQMTLIDAFTNPLAYIAQGSDAAAELVRGASNQVGNEIDEFVTGALRNNLLGLPLDLAALNIARGRDTGVAPLNLVRNQIYSQTHDAELKAYESWADFGHNLKHEASLINFVAAYGKHLGINDPMESMADKRAEALKLVTLGMDASNASAAAGSDARDAWDFMHSQGTYANDLNNPNAVHAQWSTGSVTGVDNVDLWIGGLAEKQNLFGGLLGSTFDFIFRNQMEALQDADRLYYLPRIEGMQFATQIEQNTFAEMIMTNTGAKGLGASVFMTPEYVVDLDKMYAKDASGNYLADDANGNHALTDPAGWLHNGQTGKALLDTLDDGTVRFLGDDNFLGNTMVMLGTERDDKMIAGNADDDTVYGYGGNDHLDGGGGDDTVFGGAGNDTITDIAGNDSLHGGDGNDNIDGGSGDDLIFGDAGNDLLNGGRGIDDIQGGLGNDIIFGGEGDDELTGNEGSDWISGGDGSDLLVGDIGAPTGDVPLYATNDVLDGGAQGDKMDGFSGDDIMLGEGGFDKFIGRLGFDWGSFEKETHGVSVDMTRKEFVPVTPAQAAGDAIRDFWVDTEGVSGSRFDDYLQGTDAAKADTFNELANVNLIKGLDQYFQEEKSLGTPVAFSGGNIMLGGGGSDFIEGRLGNDIIDGDNYLHVELTRDASGNITPDSQIVREIRSDQVNKDVYQHDINGNPVLNDQGLVALAQVGDIDTAVFSGDSTNYGFAAVILKDANGNPLFDDNGNPKFVFGSDGTPALSVFNNTTGETDTLYNIERLQFADQTIDSPTQSWKELNGFATDHAATTTGTDGTPSVTATIDVNDNGAIIGAGSPVVGDVLSVVGLLADPTLSEVHDLEGVRFQGVVDATTVGFNGQNIPLSELHFQWQSLGAAKNAEWVDIVGANGQTFTPTDFFIGQQIRVVASFTDGAGAKESVHSVGTGLVVINTTTNHAPTLVLQGPVPDIPETSAEEGQSMTVHLPFTQVFTDDTTAANSLTYTATLADGSPLSSIGLQLNSITTAVGGPLTDLTITGRPQLHAGTPQATDFHGEIHILVKATDAGGLSVTDQFQIDVLPSNHAPTDKHEVVGAVSHTKTGVELDRVDLQHILEQIQMAEAGQPPVNPHLAFGLRNVDGTDNSTVPGQSTFGSADQQFPRVTDPLYQNGQYGMSYGTPGNVVDSDPRTISNLIADQTKPVYDADGHLISGNPAALEAQNAALDKLGTGYQSAYDANTPANVDASGNLFIPNVVPDNGLSAPYNTLFTLFGQFFDHGLDLVTKGNAGTVIIPLKSDDPLVLGADGIAGTADDLPAGQRIMVLSRATTNAGPDGKLGTPDDVNSAGTNTITPFVDQSQTYASNPSHQAFLREYVTGSDGKLHSTGKMLTHTEPGQDGMLGNADDITTKGMATWSDVKLNAMKLGIHLTDANVNNVPTLLTDEYGNLKLGTHGFAQVAFEKADGSIKLFEGNAAGLDLTNPDPADLVTKWTLVGTGHAFINDKAHSADPFDSHGNLLTPDEDNIAGTVIVPDAQGNSPYYDNELLDSHFVAGDGRVNENIGLTSIHEVFHSEHNRLVAQIKTYIQGLVNNGDQSFAKNWVLGNVSLADDALGNHHQIADSEWNGERIFQAAKFATETQYQHLVFEEFARKVSPAIHVAGDTNIHLDPAITAEFAHAVYRFGHSMLDETLNRFDAQGAPVTESNGQQMTLIDAFTNPLAYLTRTEAGHDAAGELVRGATNQVGNEIDEFVTGALRNNLLGLPLDLAALNIARGRDTGVAPLNLVRNQIFSQTGDAELKAYESWADFGHNLKHEASLINFVAAYGKHYGISEPTATLTDKRTEAMHLVTLGMDVNSAKADIGTDARDAYDFMHSKGVYANDLTNPNAIHAQWSTGSITGVDNVDLWIGGLAEKQNLFGGLLGSTFDFIFRNQMEALQDADRLYYLPRVEGMQFATEIEQNTFADMIMRNTDAKHLSASIFMTPEYTVEADSMYKKDPNDPTGKTYLYNADGTHQLTDPSTWLHNPGTGKALVDVLNDGTIRFLADDNFLGNTMVMGGTDSNDKLIAGNADDDTVYGDGGDDVLDGGGGDDTVFGGTGNDTITDIAGNDTLHGGDGNDNIDGGSGDDLIFGDAGNDLINGGRGIDDIQGGLGNDIIFGGEGDDEIQGNEGDDWIEGGDGGDVLVGDVGAPTGQVPLYGGNDVLIGGAQGDKMDGFSGDDIMLGEGGFDKFLGRLGFDWGSFERETHGVSADMEVKEFVPVTPAQAAGDAIRDIWQATEGISGSKFDDFLQGTQDSKPDTFNELDNVSLIKGLDRYFPGNGPVAFSGGNIMLGGGGSDFLEGRGGNDIIDGDAYLHVELTKPNGKVGVDSQIVREILTDTAQGPSIDSATGRVIAGDIDTAVFSDVRANYTITFLRDPTTGLQIFGTDGAPAIVVSHLGGTGKDGTDTLYNIERLKFSDVTLDHSATINDSVVIGGVAVNTWGLGAPTNHVVSGTVTFAESANAAGVTNAVGDTYTATANLSDFEGTLHAASGAAIPNSDLHFQWQTLGAAKNANWIDIQGATDATFTPGDFYVGQQMRVEVSYTDGQGVHEVVDSTPTALLVSNPLVNHAPQVAQQVAVPGLPDTSADAGNQAYQYYVPVLTVFTDDTTPANQLVYTATITDENGQVIDQSAVGAALKFQVNKDTAGNVVTAEIVGTMPTTPGVIKVLVTATDAGDPATAATPGAHKLTVTNSFSINVLPQSDVVTAADDTNTVYEDGAPVSGNVLANDAHVVTAKPLTVANPGTIVTDWGTVHLNADGTYTYTLDSTSQAVQGLKADATLTDVIAYTATDGISSASAQLLVTVIGANDPPAIVSSSTASISENTTDVTTVAAVDPDKDPLTYSIVAGLNDDAALFKIDPSSGKLAFVTAPNFESPADKGGINLYNITVQVTDGVATVSQAMSITVKDANDAPVIGGGDAVTTNVYENTTFVEKVQATDEDAISRTFPSKITWSIVNTGDGALFKIDGVTGELSFISAPDFENPTGIFANNQYDVTVKASDGQLADTQVIHVKVQDVNEAPVITSNGGGDVAAPAPTINENTTFVTTMTARDDAPDVGHDTWSIVRNVDANGKAMDDGAAFTIDALTGKLSFLPSLGEDNLGPDFEKPLDLNGDNTYDVTVQITDSRNPTLIDQQTLHVHVLDVAGITVIGTQAPETINGTPEADTLSGLGGNDIINGFGGNDLIDGGAGLDKMTGGNGNDTYVVDNIGDQTIEDAGINSGIDTVQSSITWTLAANVENLTLTGTGGINGTGNDLDNVITGNSVNNVLAGGAGNDFLDGGLGNDTMIGGTGNDTYVVNATGDIVTELANEGIDTVMSAITYTLVNTQLENVTLTGIANINATGNAFNNVLIGNSGNNSLNGGLGADTMTGGLGNDTYVVDNVGDVVIEKAGEGTDLIQTTLNSLSGPFSLMATPGLQNVENLSFTGTGDFVGIGNALNNIINGGGGNDVLDGGLGADTMAGGLGNDTYYVDSASDVVTESANAGNDTIITSTLSSYSLAALVNVENLTYTGSTAFVGTGNGAANIITGGSGNDVLNGGTGADKLIGGLGNDTYVVDNVNDVVVEDSSTGGNDSVQSSVTYSLSANVENLTLTGTGNINGTGNDLANTLVGNGGNNVLDGGTGADAMSGGAGNDIYVVDNVGDTVTELAASGTDTVQTTLSSYTLALGNNVENLTYTGAGSFVGSGNELANVITGGALSDTLSGGDGNDTLDGGAGADTLIGGAGNDLFRVDASDTVVEDLNGGIDTEQALSSGTYQMGANVENLTYVAATGAFTAIGTSSANTITGGAGDDIITGGLGNDTLNGGAGNDTFNYTIGDGNDNVDGGVGTLDKLVVSGAAGTVNETLAVLFNGTVLTSVAGGSLINVEQVLANLGGGTDTLSFAGTNGAVVVNVNLAAGTASGFTSIAGIENVVGGAGADIIAGDSNNNSFTGGAGNDVFKFAAGFGKDTITDFDADPSGGQDKIDLTAMHLQQTQLAFTYSATSTIVQIKDAVSGLVGPDSITVSGNHAPTVNGQANAQAIDVSDFVL